MYLRGKLSKNLMLADHTSWRIGGVADTVYQPADIDDLATFLSQLPKSEPLTFLGLGSNTLVRDGGIRGTVILTFPTLTRLETLENARVKFFAGVASTQAARFASRHGLVGLEFLAGIPGSIGGALAMNAGCYGGETWQFVESVEMIDQYGNRSIKYPDEFEISYRSAKLKHLAPCGRGWLSCETLAKQDGRVRGQVNNEYFTSVIFKLNPGDKDSSLEKIRQMLEKRNAAQPTNLPSCGSVFRNPPNDFAGRLIEKSGLKGFNIGDAAISTKHANFIVNHGHATAKQVEELIQLVEKKVLERENILLEREVKIIGESK
jgi:UDP-N-acetylmuramate dehydrogenase